MCSINNKSGALPVQTSFSALLFNIFAILRLKSEPDVPYSTVICLEKKSLHFISF